MPDEEYPDLSTEAVGRIAQAALPAATLADVAARLAAARRDEQDARDRRRLADLRQQRAADQAAAAAVYGPALNTRWLAAAGLADLGAAWHAGHANAEFDPRAAEAAALVEQRLRHLHPPAMRHYDRRRGDGLTPAAAMAEAARIMAFVDPTAHTGPAGPTQPALHATASPDIVAGHAAAAAYTPGLNPRWLQHASIFELGQVWQAAHQHAAADTRAAAAADQVEQQLRRLHPPAMRRYDHLRAAGHPPAAAMAEAARYLSGIDPTARRGQPPPTHPQLPTPDRGNGAELTVAAVQPGKPNSPAEVDTPPRGSAPPGAHPAGATAATPDQPAATPVDTARPVLHVPAVRADHAGPAAAAVLRAQMFPQPVHAELRAAQRLALPAAPHPTRSAAPTATPAAGTPRR